MAFLGQGYSGVMTYRWERQQIAQEQLRPRHQQQGAD